MITLEDKFEGLFGALASPVSSQVSVQPPSVKCPAAGKIVVTLAVVAVVAIVVNKLINYFEEQEELKKKTSLR